MTDTVSTMSTKNRPNRSDYPLTKDGDYGFALALTTWQGDELSRLSLVEAALATANARIIELNDAAHAKQEGIDSLMHERHVSTMALDIANKEISTLKQQASLYEDANAQLEQRIKDMQAAPPEASQPVGYVARDKRDGAIYRDFCKVGEQYSITDGLEWMPVYAQPVPVPPSLDVKPLIADINAAITMAAINWKTPYAVTRLTKLLRECIAVIEASPPAPVEPLRAGLERAIEIVSAMDKPNEYYGPFVDRIVDALDAAIVPTKGAAT